MTGFTRVQNNFMKAPLHHKDHGESLNWDLVGEDGIVTILLTTPLPPTNKCVTGCPTGTLLKELPMSADGTLLLIPLMLSCSLDNVLPLVSPKVTTSQIILFNFFNQFLTVLGLNTNWYVPNSNPTVQGTTNCGGSGTPSAEFGAEASRTMWRVVLDYLWSADNRAIQFLNRATPHIAQRFSSNQNLGTGCLVNSIHSGWLDNAFMYGPCLSTLAYPASGITQAQVNAAGTKLAGMLHSGSPRSYSC